jgi:hypothetical protein
MSANNFRTSALVTIIFLCWVTCAQKAESIPKTATILETQTLNAKRKMVLWMPDPEKHPNEVANDDFYSCFDQGHGSYYTGEVRVTLIDSKTSKAINTLKIKGDDEYEDRDSYEIDIPYLIRGGYYYKVPNPSSNIERRPQIMDLKDYNGDGRAQEFAIFGKEACVGLGTTLIGYSEKQDRVIQYPISIKDSEGSRVQFWLDSLFSEKPIRPGYWLYEVDYRGREGTLDRFTVRYDKSKEKFTASVIRQR